MTRGHRDVEYFLEGSGAGLAGLGLGHIHQLVAVREDEVAVPVEDLGTLGDGTLGPRLLCDACAGDGRFGVLGSADGDGCELLAGEHLRDGLRRPGCGVRNGDEIGEPREGRSARSWHFVPLLVSSSWSYTQPTPSVGRITVRGQRTIASNSASSVQRSSAPAADAMGA